MKNDNTYWGVDPSITNTGLVGLDSTGEVICLCNGGTYATKKISGSVLEYARQAEFLLDKMKEYTGVHICYEDYSYNSVHYAHTISEFNGILKYKLLGCTNSLQLVAPTVLKKFATGYGMAVKEQVMEAAYIDCKAIDAMVEKERTSDICDAYFLAKLCFYMHNMELAVLQDRGDPLLRSRLDVAAQLKKGKRK